MARRKLRAEKAQNRAQARHGGPVYDFHRTARASAKTDSSRSAPTLSLSDRFNALPAELRAEIFAQLLVRPVKWQVEHSLTDCEALPAGYECCDSACATGNSSLRTWRHHRGPEANLRHPFRSAWAPEQTNGFICSECFDARVRARPFPQNQARLPCLCARRTGLQVLLVCRAWYAEAAAVLYSRNVFAFSHPKECVDFVGSLAPRWRAFVSKVSLVAHVPHGAGDTATTALQQLEAARTPLRGREGLAAAWAALRRLPALSELELDAMWLTDVRTLRIMMGPSLRNLRRVDFWQRGKGWERVVVWRAELDVFVWPALAKGQRVTDSELGEEVARAIKGWRYGWKKGKCYKEENEAKVLVEREKYLRRFGGSEAPAVVELSKP